jgi:hypothetical protein
VELGVTERTGSSNDGGGKGSHNRGRSEKE